MINIFKALWNLFTAWLSKRLTQAPIVAPVIVEEASQPVHQIEEEGTPPPPAPAPEYLFDTPQNSRHSIRVICDEEGLPLVPTFKVSERQYLLKDILCACIEQESRFYNVLPSGKPTTHPNLSKSGKLLSTDWGICQVNDYYHIGIGKSFPSVEYVMNNPDKVVRWMARLFKAGKMNLWSSFVSGAYEKYLPQN